MTVVFMKFTEIQAARSPSWWKIYIGLHRITPEGYGLHWHSRENVKCSIRIFITDTVSVNIL